MDRGYLDFKRLNVFHLGSPFFVIRSKTKISLKRRYSHPVRSSTGVRSDQTVVLAAIGSARVYPNALRRIVFVDPETAKRLEFLTNNFDLPAETIAKIQQPVVGFHARARLDNNHAGDMERFRQLAVFRGEHLSTVPRRTRPERRSARHWSPPWNQTFSVN